MEKQTLLEIVQRVAEFIDAGTVNSIKDTRESMQIAKIVKETYIDLLLRREIEVENTFYSFDSIIEPSTHPVYLKFKSPAINLSEVSYLNEANNQYTDIKYLEPMVFMQRQRNLQETYDSETGDPQFVEITDYSGVKFKVRNNKHPQFFTILDDEYVVFDSFDFEYEDTIQQSKVIAYGTFLPEFILEDDFIPRMNTIHFPLLVNMAKTNASYELKDYGNPNEIDTARKQVILASRLGRRINGDDGTTWKNRKYQGRRGRRIYL